MSKVWRTDVREDKVRFEVDQQVMFFVLQGLRNEAEQIRSEIREHEDVCGFEPPYCLIRYQSLVAEYGSIEEAVKQTGVVLYDCMENLADLHTTLGKLMLAIHKADQVMKNPESLGEDPDKTDWRPADKLRELQREVVHREERSKVDTGLLEKVKEGLEKKDTSEEGSSILGLTESLPKADNPAPSTSKPAVKVGTSALKTVTK